MQPRLRWIETKAVASPPIYGTGSTESGGVSPCNRFGNLVTCTWHGHLWQQQWEEQQREKQQRQQHTDKKRQDGEPSIWDLKAGALYRTDSIGHSVFDGVEFLQASLPAAEVMGPLYS
mmetsp:Transcript_146644/g.470547  ORF Transcript_146644/g.470547 Transcript_146644/m.470547 type:complete len:118 (-) Transcript_146644:56-409(-)